MSKSSRNEILKFRVTAAEKQRIEERAALSNCSLSSYLRGCALFKPITVITGADQVASELRKIGGNINQIAKLANAGYAWAADFETVRKELNSIWQQLNSLHRDVR